MKYRLELNVPDDRVFLNYWNSATGNDVVCQMIDGKLMLSDDANGDREIPLSEFVSLVQTRAAMETQE